MALAPFSPNPGFRRRASRSTKPWRRGSLASRTFVLKEALPTALDHARTVLQTVGEERTVDDVQSGHVIEVVTPSNVRSSGNVVRVNLEPVSSGTQVTIDSAPGAQLFDWGASKRLVAEIADRLS